MTKRRNQRRRDEREGTRAFFPRWAVRWLMNPLDFLNRRLAVANQVQGILLHKPDAVVAGQRAHFIIAIPGTRSLANGAVQAKQFVDADPAAIPGGIARFARARDLLLCLIAISQAACDGLSQQKRTNARQANVKILKKRFTLEPVIQHSPQVDSPKCDRK